MDTWQFVEREVLALDTMAVAHAKLGDKLNPASLLLGLLSMRR